MGDLSQLNDETVMHTMERIRQILAADGWGIERADFGRLAGWQRIEARKGAEELGAIARIEEHDRWAIDLYLPSFPFDQITARTVADVQHTFMQDRKTTHLHISDLGW